MSEWVAVLDAQRAELVDQIESAVERGDMAALSALLVSSATGTQLLLEAMSVVAGEAAVEAVDAAARQGATAEPEEPERDVLAAWASAMAAMLAQDLAVNAGREALRRAGPDKSGAQVAREVSGVLEDIGERALRDQLGGSLWMASNAGKFETLRAATPPPDYWVANEVRDGNTCDPCKDIDGQIFLTVDETLREYPNGGHRNCKGGVRCRGTAEPVWGEIPEDILRQTQPKVPEDGKPYQKDLEEIESVAATRLAVAEAEKRGTVEWTPLTGGMSSDTRLAVLPDGRRIVHKRGPSWNDPEDSRFQADAEQAAGLLARELELRIPRVYRDEPESVWMEMLHGKTFAQLLTESDTAAMRQKLEDMINSKAGVRMGLLDFLSGNNDRNSGNRFVTDDGELAGLDHGAAWLDAVLNGSEADVVRAVQRAAEDGQPVRHFVGPDGLIKNPLTKKDVKVLRKRLELLRDEFKKIGREDWLNYSLDALEQVGAEASGEEDLYG